MVTAVSGTCATAIFGAASTATFVNPPLFDIQVNYRDGGPRETSIVSITCDGNSTLDATRLRLATSKTRTTSPSSTRHADPAMSEMTIELHLGRRPVGRLDPRATALVDAAVDTRRGPGRDRGLFVVARSGSGADGERQRPDRRDLPSGRRLERWPCSRRAAGPRRDDRPKTPIVQMLGEYMPSEPDKTSVRPWKHCQA